MQEFLDKDAISGKEGTVFAKLNGNNEPLLAVKNIEVKVTLKKGKINSIGRKLEGSKITGMTPSGTMTAFYVYPTFRRMAEQYKETGIFPDLELVLANTDTQSAAGEQRLLLTGIIPDEVTLFKLDGDTEDALEEEIPFTFSDFRYLKHFNKI